MIRCSHCTQTLSVAAFSRDSSRFTGRQHRCINCQHIFQRRQYAKNRLAIIERTKRNAKLWRAAHPEEYKHRWKIARKRLEKSIPIAEHRRRRRAQDRLRYAVEVGHIIKPENCARCARRAKIEASHHDYARPFEIEWLCRSCHVKKDLWGQKC